VVNGGIGNFGDGLKNPVGKPVIASFGGIQGHVSLAANGVTAVVDGGIPWLVSAPLTNTMQGIVGSDRKIVQASADIEISGDIPAEFINQEIFKNFIKLNSRIAISIGGTAQAIYSFEQMEDTKFIQRALNVILVPDPTLFSSLSFRLVKESIDFFPTPISTYFVHLTIVTYWDYPPPVRRYPQKVNPLKRMIGATR
jgi:hypothetical protein